MAQKVLIMGESGTGKSTSLFNCDPELTFVVNPVGKPLPFRNSIETVDFFTAADEIIICMKDAVKRGKKIIVVDDFQYLLAIPYMNRIKESGWDKYNDFGANYFDVIDVCKELPDDVIVYYLTHLETLDSGLTTVKLIGKQLREKITIEGLFTIVLRTSVQEGKYYFLTQNSGKDTVKSPIGMFGAYAIDNDLNYVDEKIRNYYHIGEYKSDAEIAEADKSAENTEIQKPEPGERRRRGGQRTAAPAPEKTQEEIRKEMDAITDEGVDFPFETDTKEEQKPATRTRRTRKER
ncbi:MAG: ATP-binding protein [Bacteroidales bacterium]|nr:ATP-binding protein [Bacteroidales bacterium]